MFFHDRDIFYADFSSHSASYTTASTNSKNSCCQTPTWLNFSTTPISDNLRTLLAPETAWFMHDANVLIFIIRFCFLHLILNNKKSLFPSNPKNIIQLVLKNSPPPNDSTEPNRPRSPSMPFLSAKGRRPTSTLLGKGFPNAPFFSFPWRKTQSFKIVSFLPHYIGVFLLACLVIHFLLIDSNF